MRYINLKYISLCFLLVILLLLITYSHFIFTINFNNKKITIKLRVQLLLRLIRINIQLYPPTKKKNKKNKINLKDFKFLDGELSKIYELIRKVKIVELYSDIYFSNIDPYITIYINALINGIYGNITNILKCEKLYLNIVPKFTENNIKGSVKIHIKLRLKSMFKSIPILIRIIKSKFMSKEGDKNDSNKFNTKHYGNNS